jgi:drug/metabolite transporter (DMT)-like permease
LSEAPDRAAKRTAAGCLAAGALFAVVFIAVWLAAITLYGLVVEQWEMVSVRHEFGYEWAFLYAPLIAFGLATAAAFVATRRLPAARLTLLIVTVGLVALFVGILLFGLGGLL